MNKMVTKGRPRTHLHKAHKLSNQWDSPYSSPYLQFFSKRRWPDLLGLYVLFLLLLMNPFHFVVTEKLSYYREFLVALFSILLFFKVTTTKRLLGRLHKVRKEIFFLVLFPFLLILFAIVDAGKNLYGSDILSASLRLEKVDPILYVLRNAFLYIPMVLYFAVRGLTKKEISQIALVTVIVAPFSVLQYLIYNEIATLQNLGIITQLGGLGLSYNSFLPYLTFPVLSAMYLIATDSNKIIKLISISVIIALSIYILLSAGRQTFLFVIICGLVFFLKSREMKLSIKLVFAVITICIALLVFQHFTAGYKLSDKFLRRYTFASSAIETQRLEIIKDGLTLLQPHEHLMGAGLTSVIFSGPHNDYVRWWQRIGFFAMVLGFLPFFLAARKGYLGIRRHKYNALNIYITLAVVFTLYNSLFGYPREDAFQATYCFLGIAIWLGIERYGIIPRKLPVIIT